MNEFPYHYRCPHCGKPAFLLRFLPEKGDKLLADNCFYRNKKRQPMTGEEVTCDICGKKLTKILDIDRVRRHTYI